MLTLSASLSKEKFLGLITAGLASATLDLTAPSHAVTLQNDFAGDYAPANWTFNANGGDGSVDTTAAPSSITLTGNNDGVSSNIFTDYTTTATAGGDVTFNWAYSANDDPGFDSFGYLLNNAFTTLADGSLASSSGIITFNVASGESFGFRVISDDGFSNGSGGASATISNFSAPIPTTTSVPGPLPILGVGAAFAYSRRLRRRINLAKSSVSTDSVVAEQL